MRFFISYSSKDRPDVRALVRELEDCGYEVWFDQELTGGQDWWEGILRNIRDCDAFVIALSENWAASAPCALEVNYAQALGKRLMPVRVQAIDPATVPADLQRLQIVPYVHNDPSSFKKLLMAINQLPPAVPLPDPLPPPPSIPLSPVAHLAKRLQVARLTVAEQQDILATLRHLLDEAPGDTNLLDLVERLLSHGRINAKVAAAAEALLDENRPLLADAALPSSDRPAITTKNAKRLKRQAALGYVTLGTLSMGVVFHAEALIVSDDGQMLAVGYSEDHQPAGSIFAEVVETTLGMRRSGHSEGTLVLYDLHAEKLIAQFRHPNKKVIADVAFSADGRLIAASYGDEIGLWDVRVRRIARTIPAPEGDRYIQKLALSANGELVAAHVIDRTGDAHALHVWAVSTGQPVGQFPWKGIDSDGRWGNHIYFLPGDRHCLLLHQGRLQQADLRTMRSQPYAPAADLDANLTRITLTSRRGCIGLCTEHDELIVVQPQPWRILNRFVPPESHPPSKFALSPKGNVMAYCQPENVRFGFNTFATQIELWSPRSKSGKPAAAVKINQDAKSMVFSPDSTLLIAGGFNRKVQLLGVGEKVTKARKEVPPEE